MTDLTNLHQTLHPSTTGILRYFDFQHLPPVPQHVSKKFYTLAWDLALTIPQGPELTVALRKLLEGKDAAVRAALELEQS